VNARLLALYDNELQYLREKAAELAHYRPDTASQLGLSQGQGKARDSHVERLLEGVAYLAARIHLQLESGFPQVAQSLAETICPDLICPFPACGIVEFHPTKDLAEDYIVSRGAELTVRVVSDEDRQISSPETDCIFRTAHEVTLLPLEIKEVAYSSSQEETSGWGSEVHSWIRFRLRHTKGQPLAQLNCPNGLDVYIRGQGGSVLAARTYELLVRAATTGGVVKAIAQKETGTADREVSVTVAPGTRVSSLHITPLGFSDEEALLPTDRGSSQNYRLLREFFMFPARFMFFRLNGLDEALNGCDAPEAELVIGIADRQPELETQISRRLFGLFCTPVVNLFKDSISRDDLILKFIQCRRCPETRWAGPG
jgi:type VI secretion system protein ImpG